MSKRESNKYRQPDSWTIYPSFSAMQPGNDSAIGSSVVQKITYAEAQYMMMMMMCKLNSD